MFGRNLRVAVALGLAGAVLSWWFATHTRPMSDEGAVLTAAAKLLRGGVFYREIDAYWLPGSAYLAAFAMKLFGEHLSVARVLAAISYLGMVLGLYALALRLLGARRAGLFGCQGGEVRRPPLFGATGIVRANASNWSRVTIPWFSGKSRIRPARWGRTTV